MRFTGCEGLLRVIRPTALDPPLGTSAVGGELLVVRGTLPVFEVVLLPVGGSLPVFEVVLLPVGGSLPAVEIFWTGRFCTAVSLLTVEVGGGRGLVATIG